MQIITPTSPLFADFAIPWRSARRLARRLARRRSDRFSFAFLRTLPRISRLKREPSRIGGLWKGKDEEGARGALFERLHAALSKRGRGEIRRFRFVAVAPGDLVTIGLWPTKKALCRAKLPSRHLRINRIAVLTIDTGRR